MPDERREVGAQCARLEGGYVLLCRGPGLRLVNSADHVLAWDRFDAAEQIPGLAAVHVQRRQGAGSDEHRGHSVPHGLRKTGTVEHLDVIVRVNVHHAGKNPLAGGVYDLWAIGDVKVMRRHGRDAAVTTPDIAHRRGRAATVEPEAITDDGVVGHRVIEQCCSTGVNEPRLRPRPG